MFGSKKSTRKINAVHERSLRTLLNNYEPPLSLLLEEAHQITFNQQYTNSVMIEVCKYLSGYSPNILNNTFK